MSDEDLLDLGDSATTFEERPFVPGSDLSGLRMVEALLFASSEPLSLEELTLRLPEGADVLGLLQELETSYATRGVNVVKIAGKWCFRTAEDLSFLMQRNVEEQRKLSRAALETLAIIAYHQPVTRAEIEEIRGVSTSKGTLDVLLETTWIRMRGRRRTPGRPVTYGTTDHFLIHFGLENVKDLPGLEELKGAGLLDSAVPASFMVPTPNDDAALTEDEDPLEDGSLFDDETDETAET
ncbi:MAG: SMC-Scp complex subunit ScpB [Roseibium sp.]